MTPMTRAESAIVVSGHIEAQVFDTYSRMNGLWTYSMYSQKASAAIARD